MSVGLIIAIKVIGKTSLKEFILGVGGTVNKKHCFIVFALYLAGIVASYLVVAYYISWRGVNLEEYGFLVFFMVLTAWIQTTFEELAFRGLFIRWACKNKVTYTKKALIVAGVSAVVFAIFHAPNPEVTSQNGIAVILVLASYAGPGFVCYLANLHFGNLLPGIIIHWVNNFFLYTVILPDADAVVSLQTLFVDNTPKSAVWSLASVFIANTPIALYIVIDLIKRKKTAKREA